jgi:N6-L-threonylcarbamoyladenine synthase
LVILARQIVYLLAIESTCDETAAAVIDDGLQVLGEVVASQEKLHEAYRGVVPEIAARAHVEQILPVIDQALKRAGITLSDLDAIAVANTPGLAGSLLVGVVAAKSLALALNVPLVGINHLYGHIYACKVAAAKEMFPCIGLVVSGGHTNLFRCDNGTAFRLLGATVDDAAGEAFDKVASMLGLPFPGGPALSRLAVEGNPSAYRFPRAFMDEPDRLQFSFSGLKTAVRYLLTGPGKCDFRSLDIPRQTAADIAASFQEAVVDCLVQKSMRAVELSGMQRLCVGGGVAANSRLRESLTQQAAARNVELLIAPPRLCTDNAVLGAIAWERLRAGEFDDLDLPVVPGLMR